MKKSSIKWQVTRILILLLLSTCLISWYVVVSEAQVFEPLSRMDNFAKLFSKFMQTEISQISEEVQTSTISEGEKPVIPAQTPTVTPIPQAVALQPTPTLTIIPVQTKTIIQPTRKPVAPSFPYISNSDVVTALNQYRSDHQVHQLVEHQSLCQYAQKRVADMIAFGGLDHHQGFTNDFVNGERPSQLENYPGRTIGENLAYQNCKNMTTDESFIAQAAPALIEWCFDSSTAGHREAQLNPKFNNVCVRNQNGYFVVIFGD